MWLKTEKGVQTYDLLSSPPVLLKKNYSGKVAGKQAFGSFNHPDYNKALKRK